MHTQMYTEDEWVCPSVTPTIKLKPARTPTLTSLVPLDTVLVSLSKLK